MKYRTKKEKMSRKNKKNEKEVRIAVGEEMNKAPSTQTYTRAARSVPDRDHPGWKEGV
jgi:hypothetical protein